MVRILLLMVTLVIVCSASVEAGWLDDKLKQAAESVGDRMIDDASDSAYEGTKDAVSPDNNVTNKGASGEASEFGDKAESPEKYSDETGSGEMGQPSWAGSDYGQKKKKKKKTGPPRTDLYMSTEMIINDPESSPEPFSGDIYLDGARLRAEWQYPESNIGMIVTGIEPTDKVYILMHKEKTYMESSYGETDSFSFGSGKPCDEFLRAEDLGRTKLNGRNVTKWRCSEPEDPEMYEENGGVMTLWMDNKLDIPVRMEQGKGQGYWELVNIREGKPSGNLFKIPSGYKKLAIGAIPTATSLSPQDEQLIKSEGIPLYSRSRFVYGNSSVGYRFASSESVERVRGWFEAKLSSWAVIEQYGSWIIFNGNPKATMGEIMGKPHVSVNENDKLPEWHSLDREMTTEIVIMVPQ